MRIIVLSNLLSSLPVIDQFNRQGWLRAVVSTDRLIAPNLQVEDYSRANNIPFYKVSKEAVKTELKQLLLDKQPDVVIMCGFSYRIPEDVFTIPKKGFFNVHFSLLPAYRGPMPVFWQIKNGEAKGGVSIHRVDEGFDTGGLVLQQSMPIMPGETTGLCEGKYAPLVYNMVMQLVETIAKGYAVPEMNVNESAASYYGKPTAADMMINWDLQTAEQIERLVNACNPVAGGAITTLRQQMVRILEVSCMEGGAVDAAAGTIIHADTNGLFVQCMDKKILRINILKLNEGYVSGAKCAAIGMRAGDKFENISQYHIVNN